MLLGGTVPHHVYLLLADAVVVVKKLQEKVALFDNFRVEALSEHHIEDPVVVHPLDQSFLSQPSLPKVLDCLKVITLACSFKPFRVLSCL